MTYPFLERDPQSPRPPDRSRPGLSVIVLAAEEEAVPDLMRDHLQELALTPGIEVIWTRRTQGATGAGESPELSTQQSERRKGVIRATGHVLLFLDCPADCASAPLMLPPLWAGPSAEGLAGAAGSGRFTLCERLEQAGVPMPEGTGR